MTPDWLKEIESKLDLNLSPFSHEQLTEFDVVRLLSALKLAIEGLEFVDQHMFIQTNAISNHDCDEMNRALIPAKNKAREILERIKNANA